MVSRPRNEPEDAVDPDAEEIAQIENDMDEQVTIWEAAMMPGEGVTYNGQTNSYFGYGYPFYYPAGSSSVKHELDTNSSPEEWKALLKSIEEENIPSED